MESFIPMLEWFVKTYGLPGVVMAYLAYQNWQKDKRLAVLTDQLIAKAESYAQSTMDRETSTQGTLEKILLVLDNFRGGR